MTHENVCWGRSAARVRECECVCVCVASAPREGSWLEPRQWAMPHIWMGRITHMSESCHAHEWVMSHTYMPGSCHRASPSFGKESCRICEWVMVLRQFAASVSLWCIYMCDRTRVYTCVYKHYMSSCVYVYICYMCVCKCVTGLVQIHVCIYISHVFICSAVRCSALQCVAVCCSVCLMDRANIACARCTAMTHSYVWHELFICATRFASNFATWLTHAWAGSWLGQTRDVPWSIHVFDMTHDSLTCAQVRGWAKIGTIGCSSGIPKCCAKKSMISVCFVRLHVCMWEEVSARACECVCVHVLVCVSAEKNKRFFWVGVHMYVCMWIYVCRFIWQAMGVYVHLCLYMYAYMHTCRHICIYCILIHIHVYTCKCVTGEQCLHIWYMTI